jgi:hypothetical protein
MDEKQRRALVPICVACAGAVVRIGLLAVNGGPPGDWLECVEQLWLGATWACVLIGLLQFCVVPRLDTLLVGAVNLFALTMWDVAVEWPAAAYLMIVLPYPATAIMPAVVGIGCTAVLWRRGLELSDRWRQQCQSKQHRKWHTGIILSLIVITLWGVGWGSRLSAISVVRAMGGSVETKRISSVFSFGLKWRAVWIKFEETDLSEHEWNQLVTHLRKISMWDYRLTWDTRR